MSDCLQIFMEEKNLVWVNEFWSPFTLLLLLLPEMTPLWETILHFLLFVNHSNFLMYWTKPFVSFSCGSSVVCEELIVQASVYRWEGDRTGRDSPDCGNSILRTVAEWRLVRGDKWSMSYGGSGGSWTVMNSWISQFKSVTSFWYSCLSWSKWDRVQGLAHFDLGTIIFVQVRT